MGRGSDDENLLRAGLEGLAAGTFVGMAVGCVVYLLLPLLGVLLLLALVAVCNP